MNFEVVRKTFERYGAVAGVHDVAKKAVDWLVPVPVRVLRALRLVPSRVDPSFFELPEGFHSAFLDEAQLLEFARDPELDLDSEFIRAGLAKGDRCFGIMKDRRLVSYGWYASRPTPIDDTLRFHFDPSYVYMYKGFTRPGARGQRLHSIGKAQALARESERGSKGILSYVESNNFAALQSCSRMGFESVGTILVVTVNDRPVSFVTPGCRPYRLDVQPMAN